MQGVAVDWQYELKVEMSIMFRKAVSVIINRPVPVVGGEHEVGVPAV
jgi:hypothetical protein